MTFKVLLRKGEDNDATHEYIRVLKDSVTSAFGITEIPEVYSLKEIKKDDILIIISPQTVLRSRFLKSKHPFIYWFQGVVPEEVGFLYQGVYTRMKVAAFQSAEKYILKHARLLFVVSEKLQCHYKTKYGYNEDNFIIMPCFNQKLDENGFTATKYEKPTFVYAGSMAAWQCPEETIRLFAAIKKELPEATLTLLTAEQDKARELLTRHQVEAELKYIDLQELPKELNQYKYGFLLRKDMIINKVSTPTKMNSYMASGVIPVFSNVIGDFKDVFRDIKHLVICNNNDHSQIITNILALEKQKINPKEVLDEYKILFNTYYNRDAYVRQIAAKLQQSFPTYTRNT